MNISSCPLRVWKNLYDAATMFRELACWEWMSDSDLFGVQNPQNGEIGYCCVLGELGEVFGLAVYLGTEGLEQYRKIQSGKIHRGSPEMAYSQNCLTLWFGDRSDLDKTDLQVIKELGLKFRGKNSWPQFRSLQIGYTPWYLAEDEASFLALCLEQAREIAMCVHKDPGWLAAPRKNYCVVRVSICQDGGWKWESHSLKPAPRTKGVVRPYPLDELRLQRIKKTTPTRHGTWEFDGFYSPAPVQGEDRPYFPYSFLCADHESGFIFATALTEPSTWQMEFPKAFLDCIENHHLFPNTLRLRKEELRELFEPLAYGLGIQVQLTKKLPAVDRAKKALFKFLANHR